MFCIMFVDNVSAFYMLLCDAAPLQLKGCREKILHIALILAGLCFCPLLSADCALLRIVEVLSLAIISFNLD